MPYASSQGITSNRLVPTTPAAGRLLIVIKFRELDGRERKRELVRFKRLIRSPSRARACTPAQTLVLYAAKKITFSNGAPCNGFSAPLPVFETFNETKLNIRNGLTVILSKVTCVRCARVLL